MLSLENVILFNACDCIEWTPFLNFSDVWIAVPEIRFFVRRRPYISISFVKGGKRGHLEYDIRIRNWKFLITNQSLWENILSSSTNHLVLTKAAIRWVSLYSSYLLLWYSKWFSMFLMVLSRTRLFISILPKFHVCLCSTEHQSFCCKVWRGFVDLWARRKTWYLCSYETLDPLERAWFIFTFGIAD